MEDDTSTATRTAAANYPYRRVASTLIPGDTILWIESDNGEADVMTVYDNATRSVEISYFVDGVDVIAILTWDGPTAIVNMA